MKNKEILSSQRTKAVSALSGAGALLLVAGGANAASNHQHNSSLWTGTADTNKWIVLALKTGTEPSMAGLTFANKAAATAFMAAPGAGYATEGGDAVGIYMGFSTAGPSNGFKVSAANAAVMRPAALIPWVDQLAYGDPIDAAQLFGGVVFTVTSIVGNTLEWSSPGYIGFRVTDDGETYYGWAHVSEIVDATSLTIDAFGIKIFSGVGTVAGAYDHSNPLGAGTPEPTAAGLGLLALGAAGVLRHKRKRQEAAV